MRSCFSESEGHKRQSCSIFESNTELQFGINILCWVAG